VSPALEQAQGYTNNHHVDHAHTGPLGNLLHTVHIVVGDILVAVRPVFGLVGILVADILHILGPVLKIVLNIVSHVLHVVEGLVAFLVGGKIPSLFSKIQSY
jgi:mannose/fructose/N-acetylgalactosamine-specific phosphotransferase system component IID